MSALALSVLLSFVSAVAYGWAARSSRSRSR